MPTGSRRRRRPAVLTLLAALALAGCSDPAGPSAAPGGTPATTSSTVAPTGSTATTTTSAPATTGSRAAERRPAPAYRFPVTGCRVDYGRSHHNYPATDIFAARGCAFVSPVDGRVDEVSRVDRWDGASDRGADRGGRSVSVIGVDGVRYYGAHLRSLAPGIRQGVPVRAGQLLGRTGDSGSARGTPPHLHFGISWPTRPGIWWVRRGVVYPWRYLDAWRAALRLSPVRAVRAARAAAGREVPPCRARC